MVKFGFSLLRFHVYTEEELKSFNGLLKKQGKPRIVDKKSGHGPCKILRRAKYIRNPLYEVGSREPQFLHPVTLVCILEHGLRPKKPNASSHVCGRGGKGKNRNREVCISCKHIFPETHKINMERKRCHLLLRRQKREKGEILKCNKHFPPCFLS